MAHDVDKIIGQNLRMYRNQAGVSLKELAAHIGVTYQQIQKYETGVNRISCATLYNIAHLLNVPLTSFFSGIDKDFTAEHLPETEHAFIAKYSKLDKAAQRHVDELMSIFLKGTS